MKKQNKGLKLNKSVVSELSIEKAGAIKGGKTGATPGEQCATQWLCPPTSPCEATNYTGCQTDPLFGC
jgi:hypothetical protein